MKAIDRTNNAMWSRAPGRARTAGLGCAVGALLLAATPLWAQSQSQARAGRHEAMPNSARTQAPFDPSGYWVALITRNWRQRMVVNARGDYADIPISRAAEEFADAWNPRADTAAGKQCEAYGAGIIMFLPERLHISWQDANVLQVDTDAGMQTRLLHFVPPRPMAVMEQAQAAPPTPTGAHITPSLQGYSVARWVDLSRPVPGVPNAPRYGSIEVATDHMLPGLLRKNGVPYSSQAKMTEYWDLRTDFSGAQWLTISTRLQDPVYLQAPYVYDSVFQKEANGSKWDPAPCSLTS